MYDTKTLAELEELATNLRLQLAFRPECRLEWGQLNECQDWIQVRRREDVNTGVCFASCAIEFRNDERCGDLILAAGEQKAHTDAEACSQQ